MRGSVRSSRIFSLAAAVTAVWLCGTGSAWAGHGGGDVASLQTALNDACIALNISNSANVTTTCPQLPTITQLVLQFAGLENAPPEAARFENAINPTVAVNAVNPPAGSPFDPSKVAPLAFISPSTSGGAAVVTRPDDPNANSFFYAATNGAVGQPPFTLNLVYDYPPLTNPNFAKGQFVAEISIPLVVLHSDGTESEAPITIQISSATGCGKIMPSMPCVSATAMGNFGSGLTTTDVSNLGLTVTLTFQSSPNSSVPHAVFAVQAPLLVTKTNDPTYFGTGPFAFFPPAFVNNEFGFTPKFLGLPVGIAPYAAPKCPGGGACPVPLPMNFPSSFPFCASIAVNGTVRPAVAAFLSIGTIGTTYLSALLMPPSNVTCPF